MKLGAVATCATSAQAYKAIHRDGIKSCQLVMGFTLLEMWFELERRCLRIRTRGAARVYMYFDVGSGASV